MTKNEMYFSLTKKFAKFNLVRDFPSVHFERIPFDNKSWTHIIMFMNLPKTVAFFVINFLMLSFVFGLAICFRVYRLKSKLNLDRKARSRLTVASCMPALLLYFGLAGVGFTSAWLVLGLVIVVGIYYSSFMIGSVSEALKA